MQITVSSFHGESLVATAHTAAKIVPVTAHFVWIEHQGLKVKADADPSKTVHLWHNVYAATHGLNTAR